MTPRLLRRLSLAIAFVASSGSTLLLLVTAINSTERQTLRDLALALIAIAIAALAVVYVLDARRSSQSRRTQEDSIKTLASGVASLEARLTDVETRLAEATTSTASAVAQVLDLVGAIRKLNEPSAEEHVDVE